LFDSNGLRVELEHFLSLDYAHRTLDKGMKNEEGKRKELVNLIYSSPQKKTLLDD
jgi:hypothetical protein